MARGMTVALLTEAHGPHLDIYIDCVASASGVSSAWVADSSGAALEKARSRLGARLAGESRDPLALLRESRPDLAVIAFPADTAPAAIAAALDAGAHVLAEKPACVRAAEFERLERQASAKGRHLMLALATRMNPLVRKARDLVREGALGKLYGGTFHFVADQTRLRSPKYHQSWYASKARAGGGHLAWLGIHYLDLAQFISGQRVTRVGAFAANVGGQPIDVEDSASLVLEFEKGMLATLQSGYYLDRNYQSLIRIWGSEGWLSVDLVSGEPLEWHRNGTETNQTLAASGDSSQWYPRFVQAAVDAAAGSAPPPVTGAECLSTLRAVFGAYEASSTGKTQELA